MPTINSRLAEAFDVGAWKLEDKPRERFTATPDLHTELIRVLGVIAEHGASPTKGVKDLLAYDEETASTALFTFKSHLHSGNTHQPTRYNEIELRFRQGLIVQGRGLELVSIFHTEDLDLSSYPELVGGRHVKNWGAGVLGMPLKVPDMPSGIPNFDTIEDAKAQVEALCPATPQGMASVLSNRFIY